MRELLLRFVQDDSGNNSSKRLMGMSSGYIFCFLALVGGLVFLHRGDEGNFKDTLLCLIGYSLALFGVTAYEKGLKNQINGKLKK